MRRVVCLCILHCLQYLLMEYVVSGLVENLVMGPATRFLLGDDGEDVDREGGDAGRGEEDGGSA